MWPEQADAVRLFAACRTQWRIGAGGVNGLDYAGVRAAAAMLAIVPDAAMFERLQVLEGTVLKLQQEEREVSADA